MLEKVAPPVHIKKLIYQELNLHIAVGHQVSGQSIFCGKDLLYKCPLVHYGNS